MKICYAIMCHKNAQQVNDMISALNHPNAIFLIHIDKKSNIENEIDKQSNIYFCMNRIDTKWGGPSFTQTILQLYKESKVLEYDYFVLLSGQDFPIKSNRIIFDFFTQNYGKEFVDVHTFDEFKESKYRYERYNIFTNNRKLNYCFRRLQEIFGIKRNYNFMPTFYKGSNWHAVSKPCVEYVLSYVQANRKVISYFDHVDCSDEIIIQTILMQSPFKGNIMNISLWDIHWRKDASNPEVLTMNDYESLIESNKLFARKFDYNIDKQIVDRLKEHNYGT